MTPVELASSLIATGSLAVAVISAVISWKSVQVARAQAELVSRKIGMVSEPERMTEILPVWYIDRMATDDWGFGLLLTSGDVLAISRIVSISTDGNWMEVRLLDQGSGPAELHGRHLFYSPVGDRNDASVRI